MERNLVDFNVDWSERAEDIDEHRFQGVLTDVEIQASGNVPFKAHKIILLSAFPSRKAELVQLSSDILLWDEYDADTVESALDYAYTGTVELDVSRALRLIHFAANIKCPKISQTCLEYISAGERINSDNVSWIWKMANSIKEGPLIGRCLNVMMTSLESISTDAYIWGHTDPMGMGMLLERASKISKNTTVPCKILDFWLKKSQDEDRARQNMHNLCKTVNLKSLSLQILSKALILATRNGLADDVLEDISGAITDNESRGSLDTPHTSPSTSQQTASHRHPRKSEKQEILVMSVKSQFAAEIKVRIFSDLVTASAGDSLATIPTTRQLKIPYRSGCSYVTLDDSLYIIGAGVTSMDVVDLSTGESREGPPMQLHRHNFSAVASEDAVLVFGGTSRCQSFIGKTSSSCEQFDVHQRRWSFIPYMRIARCHTAAVFVPGEGVLVVGGCPAIINMAVSLKEVEFLPYPSSRAVKGAVNPKNIWQRLPDMQRGRSINHGIVHFNGRIYVAGGEGKNVEAERGISVEWMAFPSPNPHWTLVTANSGIPRPPSNSWYDRIPSTLLVFGGELLFINRRDGQMYGYHERTDRGKLEIDWRATHNLGIFFDEQVEAVLLQNP